MTDSPELDAFMADPAEIVARYRAEHHAVSEQLRVPARQGTLERDANTLEPPAPNRKQRRAAGKTNREPVLLRGEVDWNDGRMTVESFPSTRAVKRISGSRKKTR